LNAQNKVRIDGCLLECEPVRYTPAGIPAVNAVLAHQSQPMEAGSERKTEFEIPLIALGDLALQFARFKPGVLLRVEGFLAAYSMKRRREFVLHMQSFELLN